VNQVPPVTIYKRKNGWNQTKYWDWKLSENYYDYKEATQEVRRLLKQAVNRQMVGNYDIGCELSGGIDSSALAILSGGECYTVDFEKNSELKWAQKISDTTIIKANKSNTNLSKTIYHLEDLRAGASWSNYLLYKNFKNIVGLSGAGSDELFMGYTWRYEGEYFDKVDRTKIGGRHDEYCRYFIQDDLEFRRLFDLKHFLTGLFTVGDKLSMAHTKEIRVPFMDNDLVDFVTSLPPHYLYGKRILKDALKGIVPDEILTRKKQGFSSPDYFQGFKYDRIKDYISDDEIALSQNNVPLTWALVAFEQWLKEFQ